MKQEITQETREEIMLLIGGYIMGDEHTEETEDELIDNIASLLSHNGADGDGWISVDTPPENTRQVLVWIDSARRTEHNENRHIAYYTPDGWAYYYGDLMNIEDANAVTKWAELPEPPKITE